MSGYDLFSLERGCVGQVTFRLFNPVTGKVVKTIDKRNQILFGGADIFALLLGGQTGYGISTLYVEFENLTNPADPITPPAFDRSGGLAYYAGLAASPNRDFLRVPLTTSPAFSTSGAEYKNNLITFFGVTEGLQGFHGKPFGETSNSAVIGAGLVASPDTMDQSKDLVFSRLYTGIDKILKSAGFQVGITWQIALR